jgi:tetratricopeptide (TPR) repeat protein
MRASACWQSACSRVSCAHHDLYSQLGRQLHALLTSRQPDERTTGHAVTRAEYANLTTALDHALADGHPVMPFIYALEEYLGQAKQQRARCVLLDHAIDTLTKSAPADRRAELAALHNLAGVAAIEPHRLGNARAHPHTELDLYQQLDNRRAQGVTYHQLGSVAQEQRRFDEAETNYRKALQIYNDFNDEYETADVYHQLGSVALEQRRFDEAETNYRKALQIFLEFDDRYRAASTQSQLGILLTEVDRLSEAVPFSLDALFTRRQTTSQWLRLNLRWLKRQRRLVGDDTFATVVLAHSNGCSSPGGSS